MKTNRAASCSIAIIGVALLGASAAHAGLLAHEPFTNAPGTGIISSTNGYGFNGAWLSNGSSGTATNTGYGLNYTDGSGNQLLTAGGAVFFRVLLRQTAACS